MSAYSNLIGTRIDNFTLLNSVNNELELLCHSCNESRWYDKQKINKIQSGLFNHCGCERKKSVIGTECCGYKVVGYIKGISKYEVECLECNKTRLVPVKLIRDKEISQCSCHKEPITLGMMFGSLTIVSLPEKKNNRYMVMVKCECGTVFEHLLYNIKKQIVKSCGCHIHKNRKHLSTSPANLVGMTFGDLRVMESIKIKAPFINPEGMLVYYRKWLCKCVCGNEKIYTHSKLMGRYPPKDCGCKDEAIYNVQEQLNPLMKPLTFLQEA